MSGESDSKIANEMVLAAKQGKWDDVYTVLSRKPYLVNMIPEGRTWAALHQAVWQDNKEAVERLLNNCSSCDPLVVTKHNSFRGASLTPRDLARDPSHPSPDIERVICDFIECQRQERFGTEGRYFVLATEEEATSSKDGLPLLCRVLVEYKLRVVPERVNPCEPFHDILKEMSAFSHKIRSGHWLNAKDKIVSTLKTFCLKSSIQMDGQTQCEDDFYKAILEFYAQGGGRLHHYINVALRRASISQKLQDYKPEGDELAIVPYILMLDAVLFCWKWLLVKMFNGFSYRGVGMLRTDALTRYKKGFTFLWLQLISATKLERVARRFGRRGAVNGHYTLFKIDNSTDSFWQPRDVVQYSAFPTEAEVIYPLGAEFEVQKVDNEVNDGNYSYTTVHLKLVSPPAS